MNKNLLVEKKILIEADPDGGWEMVFKSLKALLEI